MNDTLTLTLADALDLCVAAARGAGASEDCAQSIARAAVAAEADGQATVGLSHYVDYLESLRDGRIDGKAEPDLSWPTPIVATSDAKGGSAHLGFDRAFDDLVTAASQFGLAAFSQRNAYTSGSLSWFVGRLAEAGLVALAATNGPALVAGSGTRRPVFCTNPMAFAAPRTGGPPLIVDQSSSATAFVNVRAAAERGEALPQGWALGPDGEPTTDPHQAMRGALLAFGGARGANVALTVEVLAAGLGGAKWSTEAGSIVEGTHSPGSGLFVLAIDPAPFGNDFAGRLGAHLETLARDYGMHVPGEAKAAARARSGRSGLIVGRSLHDRIAAFARS